MYALFYNDTLLDFWSNKAGDIFLINTMMKLSLDPSSVELVYYPNLKSAPAEPYEFTSEKTLKVMENQVVGVNEEDNEPITGLVPIAEYSPEIYYSYGEMLKPC